MGQPNFSFKVNPLFFMVFILFVLAGLGRELMISFTLVILHEFVHYLVARQAGYHVYKMEIFPFGGMAEYSGLLEMEPRQEAQVALAGPLFNLVLAGLFFILQGKNFLFTNEICNLLIYYNLILGFFNLLPALPLDGGRILRSLLVMKHGFQEGTVLAVKISKWLALAGGLLGVVTLLNRQTEIWVLFISFFVYGAAVKEEKQFIYRLLSYLTHRKEMLNEISFKPVVSQLVNGRIKIKEVIYHLIPGSYNIFYVLNQNSNLAGIVSESRLVENFFNVKDNELKIIDLLKK